MSTGTQEAGSTSQAESWREWFVHWLGHQWAAWLFVPSLIVVLHHVGPLKPLSQVSLLTLSHWHADESASSTASDDAPIWLVYINQADFEQRYQERRPLMRCKLADDLGALLRQKPTVLAVDLDLSPVSVPSDEEDSCQRRLDKLLDNSLKTKIVLMFPFPSGSEKLAESKLRWIHDRSNVAWGDPNIAFPLNLAIEYTCTESGFAEQAYEAVHGQSPPHCEEFEPRAISYGAYRQHVHEQPASALATSLPPMGRVIFFGNRSGSSDRAVTPIGEDYGVLVHAAKFATFDQPLAHRKVVGFAMDLAFAGAFSMGIEWFSNRYTRIARDPSPTGRGRRSVWVTALLVGYLAVVALALGVAWWLVSRLEVVTEPLLIALGLGLDGFVLAGWDHVGKEDAPMKEQDHPSPPDQSFDPLRRLLEWSKRLDGVPAQSYHLVAVEVTRWLVFWAVVLLTIKYTLE